ncbi:hypothetical protein G432_12295 [Sphingomonas sp. MM-1]|nr:hypothetical protein G432_12295 [Sphingomonas sp. MM-1]
MAREPAGDRTRTASVGPDRIHELARRRACDEALVIDRLVETLRLASFRSFLASTVVSMSAIVPSVLDMVGSDVPSALQRIRPGHLWPRSTSRAGRSPASSALGRKDLVWPMRIGDAVMADGILAWVEAAILGSSLDIVLRAGGVELATYAGVARLQVDDRLPDTVLSACEGRPLDQIVDHPLLRGRGYVVDGAYQARDASVLTFDVGRRSLEMPWRP